MAISEVLSAPHRSPRGAGLRAALRRWAARRDAAARARTAASLSTRTLDDIGAPEWLCAEAAAQRNAERDLLAELRLGVCALDTRRRW